MSTLDLYNVQKARFWDELLVKERLQSLKAVSAVKTIRAQSAKTRPTNDIGELIEGKTLQRATPKRRPSDAHKSPLGLKLVTPPIVRMQPTIPNVTGPQYQKLKNNFRPYTAFGTRKAPPLAAPGTQPVTRDNPRRRPTTAMIDSSASAAAPDSSEKFGVDPRFSSQVGYHLFGFSDIQKTFPIKDQAKANEYESSDDFLDAMCLHDRKTYHPYQIYKRPVTASQDIGWNAFDPEYYKNRNKNKSLIHPLKSSDMTKFADAMAMSGRK